MQRQIARMGNSSSAKAIMQCCTARPKQKRIIGLTGNGGTDLVAEHVRRAHGFEVIRMRGPVFVACANLTGLSEKSFFDEKKHEIDARVNDTPANIADFVEKLLRKHLFHGEFLTHLFELRARDESARDIVVPDVRFDEEAEFLKKKYNATIVGLYEENHSYEFLLNDVVNDGVSRNLVDFRLEFHPKKRAVDEYEKLRLHYF